MDKREFAIFASGLKTYYPREGLLPNDMAMELWFERLKDIPFNVAETVLHKWAETSKFSPSIADIREMAHDMQEGEIPDWGEAWEVVMRGVRLYGSYEPDKAYNLMDDITETATKRVGWENICFAENIDNVRANFRMIYEAEAKKRKREAQVSPAVRDRIGSVQLKAIDEVIE